MPAASTRALCRVLGVARSSRYRHQADDQRSAAAPDERELLVRIKHLIEQHPTSGYRRIWARLRCGDQVLINRKQGSRLMQAQGWLIWQRPAAPTPHVKRKKRVATHANERWARDATHSDCGTDGWAHLIAVIDCYDRESIGYAFALRGRTNAAERAVELACLARFGTLRPHGEPPIIRSDNGLIVQRRRLREAWRFYRLQHEFITPYTPEQNGMIERWFRSLKEACVWHHQFRTFAEARAAIARWIRWYNEERPHQAVGYHSPRIYRRMYDVPPPDQLDPCVRAA